MKDIKVVIGANFGDEGKGLMTNYFALNFPKTEEVLNIRFNGTSQAGHTVVQNGKRHVFSHFGSGSFNANVCTYLSSFFFVNPIHFNKEYEILTKLMGREPKVFVCKDSPVITIYDIIYNRDVELSRGNNRHGSCGAGLWESVLRNRTEYTLNISDLFKGVRRLALQIQSIRDGYYLERYKSEGIEEYKNISDDFLRIDNDSIIDLFVDECKKMLSRIEVVDEKDILNKYNYIVFEGAQGLLLDWQNREYMPNLTASRTGSTNVLEMLKLLDSEYNLEVCYVTRSYFTRHGAGKFVTEVENKEVLGLSQDDKTNFLNPWQGRFRYGYFDLSLFHASIIKDLTEIKNTVLMYCKNFKKSICITHLNETNDLIKMATKDISIDELKSAFEKDFFFYLSRFEESEKVEI